MEKVIQALEAKVTKAYEGIEKAKGYIKDIEETGTVIHGSKDHYERSVLMNEAYITGLKASIREIKMELA